MTGQIISPDTGNYYVGKGVVSIKLTGDADYIDVGNCTEIEVTPKMTTLDHFSSRSGIKKKDKRIVTEQMMSIRIVMEEWSARNLGMALMGTASLVWTLTPTAAAGNTGDGVLTPTASPGTAKTMNGVYTLACTDATTPGSEVFSVTGPLGAAVIYASLTVGVAYTDAFNATLATGATNFIVGDAITVAASAAASIDIFSQTIIPAGVKFVGANDVGPKWTAEFPNCEFTPEKAISLISDGWAPIELDGDVLYDNISSAWGTATATFS
jgi:hypothetical protein